MHVGWVYKSPPPPGTPPPPLEPFPAFDCPLTWNMAASVGCMVDLVPFDKTGH